MTLVFPSPEFDDAVAAVCHGTVTDAQAQALNRLLRNHAAARDEYLLRMELHNRLASDGDLFSAPTAVSVGWPLPGCGARGTLPAVPVVRPAIPWKGALALAAGVVLLGLGAWSLWLRSPRPVPEATTTAVAMLIRTVEPRWNPQSDPARVGGPLEPGWLRLDSGLAQVVFYNGARVILEGPAELQLISAEAAFCPKGRLLAEVPPPARGFRLRTDQLDVVDLGTVFAIEAASERTEVHVFKGKVELQPPNAKQMLRAGQAAVAQDQAALRLMPASEAGFAALFEFQERSLASEAFRYEQWQLANARLNQDPSLVVHLEFQNLHAGDWALPNTAEANRGVFEATRVGCQRAEGRWREKQALEFQSVNDRVRLNVPGEFESLTLSAWVCVKGLDRQFNSLLMCDGFEPGTLHWLIRHDGVLGLTVFGDAPGAMQIVASPPVLTLDRLGTWLHVAAVVDGQSSQVAHYVNGLPVTRQPLRLKPPFRVGTAELGNWNARGGPHPEPALVRNLSGALDEFELFDRALTDAEILALYRKGKPDLQ